MSSQVHAGLVDRLGRPRRGDAGAPGARHVLTPDVDFLDADVLRDPYPLYRRLQEEQPVFWSSQMDAWVITRHADVSAALLNPKLFSSSRVEKIVFGYVDRRLRGVPMGALARPLLRRLALLRMRVFVEMGTRFMWQRDPPDHTRLRKLMHQGFTSAMVSRLLPSVKERVHALLDRAAAGGRMDFMADFAVPMPAMVIADIYGLSEHWRQLHVWENDLKLFLGARRDGSRGALARTLKSVYSMKDFFMAKIHERRRSPGDDLISKLATASEDGYYLDDLELCANLMVTLGAAQITTQDMLGNGLLALLRNPEQMEALRADRSLIPSAIEEIVRYDGPVQLTNRVVTEETTLRGVPLRKGQMVYLIRGAANRDPEKFADPDRFDIRRDARGHVAFGAGIHYCIGAALARAEGEIALNAILDRLRNLRLSPGDAVAYRADNLQFRGLDRLEVCFD